VTEGFQVLREEFLEADIRCGMKMVFWRKRKSAMHRLVNGVLCNGEREVPLVMLQGNGSFGCGGRGEVSVPVKEFVRQLKQGHRRLGRAGVVVTGDEWGTTKMCYGCEEELQKVYTAEGREDLSIRRCVAGCCRNNDNVPMVRDRDWNAACNIFLLFACMLRGLSRPGYLCRPPRKKAKVTLTSVRKQLAT
jgi:hypothetical protein